MHRLYVIGAGPGARNCLTGRGEELCCSLPELYAFKRYRSMIPERAVRLFGPQIEPSLDDLAESLALHDTGLLISGDPCLFSLLRRLKERFGDAVVEVVPAPGALQALFARLQEDWEEAHVVSGHGRPLTENRLCHLVKTSSMVVLFCDAQRTPAWACSCLTSSGLGHVNVAAGENLTMEGQRLVSAPAAELTDLDFSGASVVRFRNESPKTKRHWPGLPDQSFVRGAIPMSKRWVRSQILCLLALDEDSCFWDVGAGTGSVAIEGALCAPLGTTWAVEREEEGISLIAENATRLGALNLTAISGFAPEALVDLPDPTHVFIGGAGGQLAAILDEIRRRGPGIRVVLSAITLETNSQAASLLEGSGFTDVTAVQVAATEWRKAGASHLAMAQNPVTLWAAMTAGEEKP